MATHELYVGGGARTGLSRSQFPAPTFSQSDPAILAMDIARHKGPNSFALNRQLDTFNDHALAEYLRNNAVVANDVLDLLIVPKNVLQLGVMYVNIETPVAGLTLTFAVGADSYGAVDCSVAGTQLLQLTGTTPAPITNGAVSLAFGRFSNLPQILKATVTAIGAAKFGALRMEVSVPLLELHNGQF